MILEMVIIYRWEWHQREMFSLAKISKNVLPKLKYQLIKK